jgi:DNA-binding CsgD family transcriptional regulator
VCEAGAELAMLATIHSTLRGRDGELAVIGEQLDRVRAGSGAVVLLEGAPGMGKSRLLIEVERIARRLSLAVGLGAAEPSESVVEFAPLLRALFDGREPLLAHDGLRGLRAGPEQRYWMLQDLQSLIERAALERPMLICVDDLQWADAGTVAALGALPTALASLPVGWVLAARPDQRGSALGATADRLVDDGAEQIVLKSLSRVAVAQVAGDVTGGQPDEVLLRLTDRAGGNPFWLVELLTGLRREQLIRVDSGVATLVASRVPERVRASMRERLARLSESARQLAIVAASLGRTFSFSELSAMLGAPPGSLLIAVEQLLEAGMLRETGDRLSFQHDLTRDAVREASARSARRALDRHAAEVLLAAGALPVEVATQLAASAESGDERAVSTLRDAAETLGWSDPGSAADLSRRALELAPATHPLRGPLVAQTTILLHAAARSTEAKAFADEHLRTALPTDQESEVCLSIASMFALGPDERAAANRRALALSDLSRRDRARHLARLVYNLVQAGRQDEAEALLTEVRDEIGAHADSPSRAIIAHVDSLLLSRAGHFDRAFEVHRAALREGFGPGEETRQRVASLWLSDLLGMLDRFEESMEVASQGIASAQRDRQAWALDYFETWRGRQLFLLGRLSDAAAALESRFEPGQPSTAVAGLYAAGAATLGRIAIHTDDERTKRSTAAIARNMIKASAPGSQRHGAWLLALQAMADGNPGQAGQWVLGPEGGILPLHPIDVTDEPHLVRIGLACGNAALAADGVALAELRAQRSPQVNSVAASAAHARGLLHQDTADLATAVQLFGASPRPLALASALEDLGTNSLRQHARADGVEALGRALDLYTNAGASWDARRVRARLRELGVRRRVVAVARPTRGWDALTESELTVVRLVSEGLTNRETAERLFVSPHTVNSHLRHAFTKLGVNSRVEMTRLVSDDDARAG